MRRSSVGMILAVLVTVAQGCTTIQDNATTRELKSEELAKLGMNEGTYEATIEQAVGVMMVMLTSTVETNLGRELTYTEHEKLRVVAVKSLSEVFTKDEWAKAIAPIYAKTLTAPEMEQLLRFYKTPLGAKLLQVQGKLVTDGGKAGEQLMKSKEADFTTRFQVEFANAFGE